MIRYRRGGVGWADADCDGGAVDEIMMMMMMMMMMIGSASSA